MSNALLMTFNVAVMFITPYIKSVLEYDFVVLFFLLVMLKAKPMVVINIRALSIWQRYLCRTFQATLANTFWDILAFGVWCIWTQNVLSKCHNHLTITHCHYFCTSIFFCHLVEVNIEEIQSPVFRDTVPWNKLVTKGKIWRDGGTGLKVVGSPK